MRLVSLKFSAFVLAAVLLVALAIGFKPSSSVISTSESSLPSRSFEPTNSAGPVSAFSEALPSAQSDEQAFIQFMVQQLKQHHGHDIYNVQVQASLLDLKHMIAEQFGQDAERIFNTILTLAFGDLAQSILALLAQLEQYNTWYQANLVQLSEQNSSERHQLITQMRYQLLGENADEIWPSESPSTHTQNAREHIQQTLLVLDQDTIHSLDERLHVLRSTLAEATALATQNQPDPFTEISQQATLANLYFGLSSVQRDLQNLTAEERQNTINAQRAAMGYTETQIESLAQTDAEKEQRWQTGYAYMQARAQLINSITQNAIDRQDEKVENALADLRKQYFANEAPTIAAEEASGFYRFERPRLYGRN